MAAKATGSLGYPNPTRDGLLFYWYDGLASPLNSPSTYLEVRRTALTQ